MESQGNLSAVNGACVTTSSWRLPLSGHARLSQHWSEWWTAWETRRASKRTAMALSELDDAMLQDIGVQGCMLSESRAIRQAQQDRRAYWLWS